MGKQLKLTLIPFFIFSFFGEALFAADFDVSGMANMRYNSRSNQDYSDDVADHVSFINSRVRLNMNLTEGDEYQIFLQPQFARIWGLRDDPAPTTPSDTSGGLNDPALEIHQAYLNYKASDNLSFKIGRQELIYGDHLLIGNVGWSNVARSFDAAKISHSCGEKTNMDLFYSSLNEQNSKTAATGDKNFAGLYVSSSLHDEYLKNIDVYYLQLDDHTTATKKSTSAYGLRLKSDMGAFDYRIEATSESIDDATLAEDGSASQYDAELGYDIPTDTPIHVSAEYFVSSEFYNEFFPTKHKWLGFADMFSRKNISGYNLKISSPFMDSWKLLVVYHQFMRTENDVAAYNFSNAALGSGTVTDEESIASEIDLVVSYKHSDNLSYAIGASQVTPGDYLKNQAVPLEDNMDFFFVQMNLAL